MNQFSTLFQGQKITKDTTLKKRILSAIIYDMDSLEVLQLIKSCKNIEDYNNGIRDNYFSSYNTKNLVLVACQHNKYEFLDALLNAGASANRVDKNGNTALHLLISGLCLGKFHGDLAEEEIYFKNLILKLIEAGANPKLTNKRSKQFPSRNVFQLINFFKISSLKADSILKIREKLNKIDFEVLIQDAIKTFEERECRNNMYQTSFSNISVNQSQFFSPQLSNPIDNNYSLNNVYQTSFSNIPVNQSEFFSPQLSNPIDNNYSQNNMYQTSLSNTPVNQSEFFSPQPLNPIDNNYSQNNMFQPQLNGNNSNASVKQFQNQ